MAGDWLAARSAEADVGPTEAAAKANAGRPREEVIHGPGIPQYTGLGLGDEGGGRPCGSHSGWRYSPLGYC